MNRKVLKKLVKKIKPLLTIVTIIGLSVVVGLLWIEKDLPELPGALIPVSLDDFSLNKNHRKAWSLPKVLREVSGVAVVDADRIFIHNDESAVIYEFNFTTQEVTQRFQLEDPPLRIDLEGIALIGSDVYLVLSTGQIYKIVNGVSRRGIIDDYEIFDSGMEELCEIESLEEDIEPGSLVFACKLMYGQDSNFISVYRYKPGDDQSLKLFDLSFEALGGKFHPSAISTQFESYIILAGKQHLMRQVSSGGEVMISVKLKKKHHQQAEGVGFLPDGRLIIADEGKGSKGRISAYRPGADP
jgi:hypothetical protein